MEGGFSADGFHLAILFGHDSIEVGNVAQNEIKVDSFLFTVVLFLFFAALGTLDFGSGESIS